MLAILENPPVLLLTITLVAAFLAALTSKALAPRWNKSGVRLTDRILYTLAAFVVWGAVLLGSTLVVWLCYKLEIRITLSGALILALSGVVISMWLDRVLRRN